MFHHLLVARVIAGGARRGVDTVILLRRRNVSYLFLGDAQRTSLLEPRFESRARRWSGPVPLSAILDVSPRRSEMSKRDVEEIVRRSCRAAFRILTSIPLEQV